MEQELELNPFEHSVFLFCNWQKRILKALYWDKNGFCMVQKRLEKHRFPWPERREEVVREITPERLRILLDGIDFWNAHTRLAYERVS